LQQSGIMLTKECRHVVNKLEISVHVSYFTFDITLAVPRFIILQNPQANLV